MESVISNAGHQSQGGRVTRNRVRISDLHDVFLLDLDGVVYRGGMAIHGAAEAIRNLEASGRGVGYVTNNSSRRPETIVEQLVSYGIPAKPRQIVGSAATAVKILANRIPANSRVLVVGGEGLREEVKAAGFLTVDSADSKPSAVIQGFSPDVGWKELAEASFAIQAGAIWIATNQDWTLPLERGLAPGNGTLVSAVHTAVGRLPEFAGKPAVPIFTDAVERFSAQKPLFVGDRLDTDSKGANAAGIESAVVLTGVCTRKDLLAARVEERPTYILSSLTDLNLDVNFPKKTRYGFACGAAEVELHGTSLRVIEGDPQSIDALRAACATIWSSGKTVHMLDVDMRLI